MYVKQFAITGDCEKEVQQQNEVEHSVWCIDYISRGGWRIGSFSSNLRRFTEFSVCLTQCSSNYSWAMRHVQNRRFHFSIPAVKFGGLLFQPALHLCSLMRHLLLSVFFHVILITVLSAQAKSEKSLVFRGDVWKATCYEFLGLYLTAQLTNEVPLPSSVVCFFIKKLIAIKSGKKCRAVRESQTTEYTKDNFSGSLN
jgi:hypothetical protein